MQLKEPFYHYICVCRTEEQDFVEWSMKNN